jgi:hypothetical protein
MPVPLYLSGVVIIFAFLDPEKNISFSDSLLGQEISQTLFSNFESQMGEWRGLPARSNFSPGVFFGLARFFCNVYRTGTGSKTDPFPIIIEHDFLNKPTQMVPVYPVYVFVLKDIGNRMPIPEIDILVIIISDIGSGQPILVEQGFFHEPDPLRL